MQYQDQFLNILANPNIAALLWLAATTGLSIELYNPGLIFPGVVGVIALILALIVAQIIPMSQGALALLVVGAILIGLELFTGSLVLGLGGIVSLVIGLMYLVDTSRAPGLAVAAEFIVPIAVVLGGFLLYVAKNGYDVLRGKKSHSITNTGADGMIMKSGEATSNISKDSGKISIGGEYWNAVTSGEAILAGEQVLVVKVLPGLLLEVRKA
jgi:membrane-bound serine protease (ClpP class)